MATSVAVARLSGDDLRFIGSTGGGHTVVMDSASGGSAPRPAELLLLAAAGCTAMDVASILRKKRQAFTGYEVRVAGDQRDEPHPHVFEELRLIHVVEGPVDPEALRRAIELSATRYCTVSAQLASGVATIHHCYLLMTPDGDSEYREVVVTGPAAAATPTPA